MLGRVRRRLPGGAAHDLRAHIEALETRLAARERQVERLRARIVQGTHGGGPAGAAPVDGAPGPARVGDRPAEHHAVDWTRAGADPVNAEAQRHVAEVYGYERGLPVVDLFDVVDALPPVGPYGSLEHEPSPIEIALLKGVAAQTEGCRYLEIGSWRGETLANVASVAEACVSLERSAEDLRDRGYGDDHLLQRGRFSGGLANVRTIEADPLTFAPSATEERFDLVFVRGDRSRDAVAADTRTAFRLLRDEHSVIVWHGYGLTAERVDWHVFAGILDGCPEDHRRALRHVSTTTCAVFLGAGREARRLASHGSVMPSRTFPGAHPAEHAFELRIARTDTPRRETAPGRLVVIDDVFPHPLSPFRTAEYEAYLARWPESVVLTSGASLGALRDRRSVADLIEAYVTDRPELRGRVMRLSDPEATRCLTDARLVSVMFLHNAFASLDLIHAYDVPFVFTLYPGGRFRLDDAASDEQLRAVCSSPNLRKVITTQKVARDYLAARRWCDPAKVEFVYGGVFPTDRLRDADAARSRYGVDKATFDVCFVAHKYMPRGSDKGYDVFIETAARLARANQDIRFHVVGPFDASDVDIHGLEERITFHGTLTTDAFPAFYARMDVIVSPNAAFVLAPGAFDGFPTGACIEAGSCGVAVVCTDPLDQNVAFRDGEELVIVPRDAARIAERIGWLHDDADALRGLSERGQAAFLRVFDVDAQLAPRLRILSELLDSPT